MEAIATLALAARNEKVARTLYRVEPHMRLSSYNFVAAAALLASGSAATAAPRGRGAIGEQSRADVRISLSVRPRLSLSTLESSGTARSGRPRYALVEVTDEARRVDDVGHAPHATPPARLLLVVPD